MFLCLHLLMITVILPWANPYTAGNWLHWEQHHMTHVLLMGFASGVEISERGHSVKHYSQHSLFGGEKLSRVCNFCFPMVWTRKLWYTWLVILSTCSFRIQICRVHRIHNCVTPAYWYDTLCSVFKFDLYKGLMYWTVCILGQILEGLFHIPN